MYRQLFVTSGHTIINNKGTGAQGLIDEAIEADRLANALADRLWTSYGVKVYRDLPTWSLGTVVRNIRKVIQPHDTLLDIHFNSAITAQATGIEVFIPVKYTAPTLNFAVEMANGLHKVTGLPLRRGKLAYPGVKLENESQHKQLALLGGLGIGKAILVEMGFVGNVNDIKAYNDNFDAIVWTMAQCATYHTFNP